MLSQFQDQATLQTLQHAFVKQFLKQQSEWLPPASAESIEKGRELDWYVHVSPGLQWHIKNAWSGALLEDTEVISWLQHASKPIAAAALKATEQAVLYSLVESFIMKTEYEQASRLLSGIFNSCDDLGVPEQLECCKKFWAAVDCIPWDRRGAELHTMDAQLMVATRLNLATMGDDDWMIAHTRMEHVISSGLLDELDLGHAMKAGELMNQFAIAVG
jgi:hypothetical protein